MIIKISLVVFLVGLLAAHFTATPCWCSDKAAAYATITLDVKNEPLGSVLGKITKKSGWKIKVPDQWRDKPVTQTLHKVALEEALRAVLNNAGVDNLLLMYDEYFKVVTIFDTESAQKQSASRLPAQAPSQTPAQNQPQNQAITAHPPLVPGINVSDPMLKRTVIDTKHGPARVNRRTKRQSSEDD